MARQFGSKLYHLRTAAQMTQVELARQLALSAHVHISTIESGRKDPSIDLALKIADLFDVTTDYLLRDTIPVELAVGDRTPADDL
jgi:transcriptional regulator with XRE-family HTH domain